MNPAHTHNLGFALLFIIAALLLVYGIILILKRPPPLTRQEIVGVATTLMRRFIRNPSEDTYHDFFECVKKHGIMMKEIPPELFDEFVRTAQGK